MQVPQPPTAAQRRAELGLVHVLTDARTPQLDARAVELDERGGWGIWQDEARAHRATVGFARGWMDTLRMDAAIGVAVLNTMRAKHTYALPRPFRMDPTIRPLGPVPNDTSYPSGHSSASAAAAAVLAQAAPERADHYESLAASVRWARVYSGVHFPSDVVAGAAIGRAAAAAVSRAARTGS